MQEKDFVERECMSFEGFCACVRLDLQHMVEGVYVAVVETVRVNDVKLHGLVIMEAGEGNTAPIIYMEGFYDEYLHGRSLCDIEKDILRICRRDRQPCHFDTESFRDWNWAKERIVFRLVGRELNREYLKDMPYVPWLDLAVTFHCHVETEEFGDGSVAVINSHLETWGITRDELYASAMANTPRLFPPVIQSMSELISELTGGLYGMELPEDRPMYILSNRQKHSGASCILYKDVLKRFADSLGTDLYILPSSLHEVIMVPAAEKPSAMELDEMVREVNRTKLEAEEILSDHVYRFTRETGEITMQEEKDHE